MTLAITHPTIVDIKSGMTPDGRIDTIVELLKETNEVLEDATYMEGNLETGHRTTIRTGIPQPTWRKLYGGVQPTKSTKVQITDTCGMLEAYAEVDKKAADLNGNTAEFRLSEDMGHIIGMNEEFVQTLFYGNEGSEPEAFTGFTPRFNDTGANNGENVLKSGTTPDISIWLIVWGPMTNHLIYPKNSNRGLQMTDKGQVTIEDIDGSGGRMEGYRTHYSWDCGLTVRDWRGACRIQFDASEVVKDAATGPDLYELMGKALRRVKPVMNLGRPVFYMNRDAFDLLDLQANNKGTLGLHNIEDAQGKLITTFRRVPCKQVDALTSNETAAT